MEFGATKFAGIKAWKIYAPVVQWIEQRFPVPLIGVRVPAGVLIAKRKLQCWASDGRHLVLFLKFLRAILIFFLFNTFPTFVVFWCFFLYIAMILKDITIPVAIQIGQKNDGAHVGLKRINVGV